MRQINSTLLFNLSRIKRLQLHLSSFDVPDVDAFVLVQWNGLSSQHHLHSGRRDVLDGAPQHPAVSGPTEGSAPLRALGLFLRLLLSILFLLLLAERTGEREEEGGYKG